jgi:hypothetical protein
MPGHDQGVRVVREPHARPRRGVMRCAGRSAAARPGTRSCAQPPLIDNPKLLLIYPRIYLVLPLCPDVLRSNVLLRSSVILHVEMGTCARGPSAGMGGVCMGQQRGCPRAFRSGLAGVGRHNPLGCPPCTPGGKAMAGACQDRPMSSIAHAARAPPRGRTG